MILTVCLNPTLQRTIFLERLRPGEVNRARKAFWSASGKGVNAARVILQLGGKASHLTHAGGRFRDWFLAMAAADGVPVTAPDSGSEIRFCHTLIDREAGAVTEIVEEGADVRPGTAEAISREFDCALAGCNTVLITGSKAGGYGPEMFPGMVARAKEAGKRVILDFRGRDLLASLPHRPDAIKPNLAEFLETFLPDHPADAPEEETVIAVAARMMELAEEFGTAPVVTRGSADTLAVVDGEPLRIPVNEVAPVNTTGCGDAFAAGLALGLSAGEPLGEAIRWAHDAAARCAATGKPGSLL